MLTFARIVSSDPRIATTSRPFHLIRESPLTRHLRLYQKRLSRGSTVPMYGIRRKMLDGTEGGVPRFIRPVYDVLTREPIIGGSQQKALAITERMQKAIVVKNQKSRLFSAFYSMNTISGLEIAQRQRFKPGSPDGSTGTIRDMRGPSRFGNIFAQQITAPKSVSIGMALARTMRSVGAGDRVTSERLQPALQSPDVNALDLAKQEYGTPNITVNDGATVIETMTPEKERERLLFLAVVTVLGFFMLRKG